MKFTRRVSIAAVAVFLLCALGCAGSQVEDKRFAKDPDKLPALTPEQKELLRAGGRLHAQCVEAYERKDYDSAITLGQKALAAMEKAVGPDAMVIEDIVRLLGLTYVGRYSVRPASGPRDDADISDARMYFRRAVRIRERWLGPDHEATKSLRAAVIRLVGATTFED